jgi:hypothetical protein
MAKDITDVMRDTLTQVVRDAAKSVNLDGKSKRKSSNPLSGAGGVAAGAGLAALAPLAAKGAVNAARRRLLKQGASSAAGGATGAAGSAAGAAGDGAGGTLGKVTHKLGDAVGHGVGEKVKQTVDDAGGVGGVAKDAVSSALPFGGGDKGGDGGTPGVGKGRRMPVQQSMDVAVPIETAYNQWTQYEDWPQFMHRVTRVTQDDPCTVQFATKIWGKTKEFTAKIETQRPDERIKWRVSEGITHTGVVTFHELAPRLTRIELSVDVDPGSLIEKAARGMRHVKRAMRADMHRFKALIEMQELETGAWRGVIEDGELVEDHDPSYDEERDYGELPDASGGDSGEDGEQEQQPQGEADEDAEDEEREQPEAEADEEAADERQQAPRQPRRPRSGSGTRGTARRGDDGRESRARESRRRPAPAGRS